MITDNTLIIKGSKYTKDANNLVFIVKDVVHDFSSIPKNTIIVCHEEGYFNERHYPIEKFMIDFSIITKK